MRRAGAVRRLRLWRRRRSASPTTARCHASDGHSRAATARLTVTLRWSAGRRGSAALASAQRVGRTGRACS